NKLLFGSSAGTVARIIENWQTGFIVNVNSGAPMTVTGTPTLYGNPRPDQVGPFPSRDGHVTFEGTPAATGSYWKPGTFDVVKDPQCTNPSIVVPSLQPQCTLNAIVDKNTNQILLQNARPGAAPTMGMNSIFGPGRWRFDANISKGF